MKYIYNVITSSMMAYKDTNPYKPQENEYYITEDQFKEIEKNRENEINYTLNEDGTLSFTFKVDTVRLEEEALTKLRSKRKKLLEAFDKWEKAVLRGREEENDSIMLWYYDLLDLKESAFENIPDRVNYYL